MPRTSDAQRATDENPTFRRAARNMLSVLNGTDYTKDPTAYEHDIVASMASLRAAYERGVEDGKQPRLRAGEDPMHEDVFVRGRIVSRSETMRAIDFGNRGAPPAWVPVERVEQRSEAARPAAPRAAIEADGLGEAAPPAVMAERIAAARRKLAEVRGSADAQPCDHPSRCEQCVSVASYGRVVKLATSEAAQDEVSAMMRESETKRRERAHPHRCSVDMLSSAMCVRGTKGCTVNEPITREEVVDRINADPSLRYTASIPPEPAVTLHISDDTDDAVRQRIIHEVATLLGCAENRDVVTAVKARLVSVSPCPPELQGVMSPSFRTGEEADAWARGYSAGHKAAGPKRCRMRLSCDRGLLWIKRRFARRSRENIHSGNRP